jgi:hypothetical protein
LCFLCLFVAISFAWCLNVDVDLLSSSTSK